LTLRLVTCLSSPHVPSKPMALSFPSGQGMRDWTITQKDDCEWFALGCHQSLVGIRSAQKTLTKQQHKHTTARKISNNHCTTCIRKQTKTEPKVKLQDITNIINTWRNKDTNTKKKTTANLKTSTCTLYITLTWRRHKQLLNNYILKQSNYRIFSNQKYMTTTDQIKSNW